MLYFVSNLQFGDIAAIPELSPPVPIGITRFGITGFLAYPE
jgi:hypothetical protein